MISFVIPVYNEQESLEAFFKEVTNTLPSLKEDYEMVFVDDGSTDNSLSILKNFRRRNKKVKVFSFRRNQGKSEALTLGFEKSKGDYVVTLDADLQDNPSEALKLLEKVKKDGFDVASGWRKNRKDSSLKVIASKFFNSWASFFWGLNLHDYNCGLKAYTREAANNLKLYGGLHRFIPLIAYQEGFSVCEIPIIHRKRKFGKSKYGLSKLWKDFPDMLTMLFLTHYSKRPLHFFGFIGLTLFASGFGILSYLAFNKIFYGAGIGDRPIIFLGMIFVISGFQVLLTGFLADLIINVYQKNLKRPLLKYSSENI